MNCEIIYFFRIGSRAKPCGTGTKAEKGNIITMSAPFLALFLFLTDLKLSADICVDLHTFEFSSILSTSYITQKQYGCRIFHKCTQMLTSPEISFIGVLGKQTRLVGIGGGRVGVTEHSTLYVLKVEFTLLRNTYFDLIRGAEIRGGIIKFK